MVKKQTTTTTTTTTTREDPLPHRGVVLHWEVGRRNKVPQTPHLRQEEADAGPKPTLSNLEPLASPPSASNKSASATGKEEGPRPPPQTSDLRLTAGRRGPGNFTGRGQQPPASRRAPRATQLPRPPPRRGTSGAFAGRSFLRRRSLLATFGQRPPMGKSAGPLFESKRPRAPPEARACSRGLGSRPAAGLPRLRTRRGPPRRSSSQRCKRRFGAWGRLW